MNRKEFTSQPENTESRQWLPRGSAVLHVFRPIPLPSGGDGSQRERARHVVRHDARLLYTSRPDEFPRKFVAPDRLTQLHDRSCDDRPESVPTQSDLTNFSRNWLCGVRHPDLE
jgi:hypothetical protein